MFILKVILAIILALIFAYAGYLNLSSSEGRNFIRWPYPKGWQSYIGWLEIAIAVLLLLGLVVGPLLGVAALLAVIEMFWAMYRLTMREGLRPSVLASYLVALSTTVLMLIHLWA
ncbi:MAG: DoxX family protein [Deinococcales bacterium]